MSVSRVDDRDSRVIYSTPASGHHWSNIGSAESYQGTVKLTRHGGSTARLTFTGTQISVIGIISDRGVGGPNPSSTYSIDGGTPRVYNGVMGDSVQNQVTFFNSGVLSPGQHEIVVTSLVENSWYWLDHFLVRNDPPAVTTSVVRVTEPATTTVVTRVNEGTTRNNGNVGTTRITTIPFTVYQTQVVVTNETVVGGSTVTSYQTITTSTTAAARVTEVVGSDGIAVDQSDKVTGGGADPVASTAPPIGAIIGGVLGALALLALIAFFFFWKRRKYAERDRGIYTPTPRTMSQFLGADEAGGIDPFIDASRAPSPNPSTGLSYQVSGARPRRGSPPPTLHPYPLEVGGGSTDSGEKRQMPLVIQGGLGGSSQALIGGHTRDGSFSSRGATRHSASFSAYGGSQSMYTEASGPGSTGEDVHYPVPVPAGPGALVPLRGQLPPKLGQKPPIQFGDVPATAIGTSAPTYRDDDGPQMTAYPEESPPSYWAGSTSTADGERARVAATQPEKTDGRYP